MEGRFIKFIKENWMILVVLVGLITSWTTFKNNQLDFDKRLSLSEAKIEKIDPVLLQLQTSMARVETTLEFIRQQLSKQ